MAQDFTLAAVVVNVGVKRITGAGDSGFVSLEKKEPDFELTDMQDGESIYSFKGSRVWMMTITLSQHSVCNAYLSAIRLADEASSRNGNGGVGIMNMGVAYKNGTSLIVSPAGRIVAPAKVVYTNKPENREWQIALADAVAFIGT